MTPATRAQVIACKRLLAEGFNPQDMRDFGYTQAASTRQSVNWENGNENLV